MDLLESSLETLSDDEIIANRPRKNSKSGKSYYTVVGGNTDISSDSETKSKTSILDSEGNEHSTPTVPVKCYCSYRQEIEQLKSET